MNGLSFQNIIFDLGNVIVRLDSEGCKKAFAQLGLGPFLDPKSHPEGLELAHRFGLGLIGTGEFLDGMRRLSGRPVTDGQLAAAANAMLADVPEQKLDTLLRLRATGKRVFLLSNTNDLHWDECARRWFNTRGHSVSDYFDGVFLSQRMHLEKPDPRIFKEVERLAGVAPHETLFVDDLAENCKAAEQAVGWTTFTNTGFDDWMSLF